LSTAVEVFLRPFFPILLLQGCSLQLVTPNYMPYPRTSSIFLRFQKITFLLSTFKNLHHSLFCLTTKYIRKKYLLEDCSKRNVLSPKRTVTQTYCHPNVLSPKRTATQTYCHPNVPPPKRTVTQT
jgi:hypothetical protein